MLNTPATGAVVDLNSVVEGMRPLLTRIAGTFVRLEVALDPVGLWVIGERDHFEQMLLNLVVSASDTMPLGGKLEVTTRRWMLAQDHQHRHGAIPAGRWVVLRVADTGTALDDMSRARLLGHAPRSVSSHPLGSTDLSRVAAVVRRNGGHVVIEDRGNTGTAISICLPSTEVRSPDAPPVDDTPAILIVESDAWLRTTTARVLRRAGYGVLQAEHSKGALELLQGLTGSCICVMLIDVDLPEGGAQGLVQEARGLRPDLQVVLLGHSRAGWSENLLTKPFTAEELLEAVATRLGLPSRG